MLLAVLGQKGHLANKFVGHENNIQAFDVDVATDRLVSCKFNEFRTRFFITSIGIMIIIVFEPTYIT